MNARGVGIFVACAILLPAVAHAQLSTWFSLPMTLTLTPENPSPGEVVQLAVSSYAIDLHRSTIIWSANGVPFAEGVGRTEASIVAGEKGSVTDITVEALSDTGDNGFAEARISPSELQLLWRSESYAPPFFKGRKLAGGNATIHAAALTSFIKNGIRVPDADIIYTWYRNNSVLANASGRGKFRATLQGPAGGTDVLRVIAETADRSQRAEASASIVAHDPHLVLYENHPLFGILYHRAIVGDVNTIERELRVTAVPYFARASEPRTLSYEWVVNDVNIEPSTDTPETLTLTTRDYTGPADIELTAMNPADIFMRSVGRWRILFSGSGGIFTSTVFGE
jgi:hypothetical protein